MTSQRKPSTWVELATLNIAEPASVIEWLGPTARGLQWVSLFDYVNGAPVSWRADVPADLYAAIDQLRSWDAALHVWFGWVCEDCSPPIRRNTKAR